MNGESYDKITNKIIKVIYALTAVIYMYTAGFGLFSDMNQRALLITLLCPTIFLVKGMTFKGKSSSFTRIMDIVMAVMLAAPGIYVMTVWGDRIMKSGKSSQTDIILGTILIILLIEVTRRTTGKFLAFTGIIFLAYALFGPYFPTFLAHKGETWPRLVTFLYMSTEGIFGTPLGIAATYIIIFVIFGAFLETFGAGEWFVNISYALTGKYRGGPAKTAVVSSALMGMISGSSTANVATTGTFTIPLMKKTGYEPYEAAAIESVASTGGMFTPPIMGSAAFIMAEYLGATYWSIAVKATVPAILYYLSIILMVDAMAVKRNIIGVPKENLPNAKKITLESGYFVLPLLFLIVVIMGGWSPMKAAFYATLGVAASSILGKKTRDKLTISNIVVALENGARQATPIVATCATAGIIVGVLSMTGLGAKLSYTLISISNGNVYIAAVITAIITIILGCGMPVASAYIILAAVLAPTLIKMGVVPIAAHMFIFIFASIGVLTPPVAITAYTGAAIANADPNKTGWKSFRMAAVAYIIPFMFLLSPALLLVGTTTEIIMAILSATIGVLCIVCALEGYFIIMWENVSRALLGGAALLMLKVGLATDIIGVVMIIIAIALNKKNISIKKYVAVEEKI